MFACLAGVDHDSWDTTKADGGEVRMWLRRRRRRRREKEKKQERGGESLSAGGAG